MSSSFCFTALFHLLSIDFNYQILVTILFLFIYNSVSEGMTSKLNKFNENEWGGTEGRRGFSKMVGRKHSEWPFNSFKSHSNLSGLSLPSFIYLFICASHLQSGQFINLRYIVLVLPNTSYSSTVKKRKREREKRRKSFCLFALN